VLLPFRDGGVLAPKPDGSNRKAKLNILGSELSRGINRIRVRGLKSVFLVLKIHL
jgi:hypothetical protein